MLPDNLPEPVFDAPNEIANLRFQISNPDAQCSSSDVELTDNMASGATSTSDDASSHNEGARPT
jgi:hypothetical protein